MHSLRPTLLSEQEYLQLPASMTKVELVDGEVMASPAPTFRHQRILTRLVFALETWAQRSPVVVTVGQSPIDIRFAPDRILQPDAFVILEPVPLDVRGPLTRIPELCIEVLSQDRVYDRVTKRLMYAAAGVREYWVVEPTGVVERWHGEHLELADVVADLIESPLLPEFSLDLRLLTQ